MTKISEHISLYEATYSPTALRLGIDNTPTEAEQTAMAWVSNMCFEPLRKWYGKPIKINSFFRCKALNDAVGSKDTSWHRGGYAIDMTAGSPEENEKLFNYIKDNLDFTELINEYSFSWVHVAYHPDKNIKQIKKIG